MVKVRSVNIAARGVVGNGGEVGLVFDEGDEFNEVLWRRRRGSIVLNSVIVGGDGRSISSRIRVRLHGNVGDVVLVSGRFLGEEVEGG